MKKINWKVRVRNPLFWLTIIPAVATTVYTILGLLGVVPTISEDVVVNTGTALVSILSTLGVLVDPTTKGLSDSHMAMTYKAPRADDTEEEEGL